MRIDLNRIPRVLSAITQARHAQTRIVDVAVIAPIGDHHAFRAILDTRQCHVIRVQPGTRIIGEEPAPSPHRGAHELATALRGDGLDVALVDLRLVHPVEHRDVAGQQIHRARAFERDVRPQHRLPTMAGERFAQIPDETGIQFIAAGFRRVLRGPATSQVERLIAADIEGLRTEQRRVFLNQARGEIMGLGIGGVQRVMLHAFDEAERAVGVFGELTQPAMLTGAQIHVHVPERGQRRHQLDAATRAVLVQIRDVGGRERIGATPRLAELDEREGMLDIQLELIVFI